MRSEAIGEISCRHTGSSASDSLLSRASRLAIVAERVWKPRMVPGDRMRNDLRDHSIVGLVADRTTSCAPAVEWSTLSPAPSRRR